MTVPRRTARFLALSLAAAVVAAGCATAPRARTTGPAFPDLPMPSIPPKLQVSEDVRVQHDDGWRRLQAGDVRGAGRAYTEALRRSADFYPAEAGLGLVALASRQFKPAADRFRSVLNRDSRYVPAWRGLVIAQIEREDYEAASSALERLLTIEPASEVERSRLDLLRVKQVQRLAEAGRRARQAGRYAEAEQAYTRALALSPTTAVLVRELALVELASGRAAEAEARIRQAIQLDEKDAASHAALASMLEARGRLYDAAAAYERAAELSPEWRGKADSVRAAANRSGLPDELRELNGAPTVTRGQLAALIGIRLNRLLARAPKRPPAVATDIRTHWAASWITATTQAGVMDIYANHTFQPATAVRRTDLAQVVTRLLSLAFADRPAELAKLQSARPSLADIPATNVFYRSAALAVASGAMSQEASGRFQPTRPASGADVLAAIARLETLGGQ